MSIGIKVYQTKDFIRKTAQGTIDLERSLEAVREMAVAANYFKGYRILMDLPSSFSDVFYAEHVLAVLRYFYQPFSNLDILFCN